MSVFDEARRVRVAARPGGPAVIEVDGQDVAAAVDAYRITQTVDEGPEITLYLSPGWEGFGFDGLAEVMAEPADLQHVVIEFLNAVDARKLDEAVFARDDLDGQPGELTRGLLAQLKEWAAGA
ncbi:MULTISPECIES: hypothetical protein [unclassified Streptomyces]|uniref:hypothetical protein n=1 Tax=unclassified Streptomyces TaxID=2593676 RepID=UPI0022711B93|nr:MULTISPECIES: hypothetical protein [unclassified Streptomyces]MCY0922575.1 hypothetical protein [Streptomyces sp. H27-G5]MCY0961612.1 hypothetical protein [Streptomyces sp. H27-H5]